MCLAIASKGKKVTEEEIRNAFAHNHDGAGFAYVKDHEIVIEKGFFTANELIEAYNQIPDSLPHLLHFRLATAGKEDATNCHPFRVSANIAFIHNGVMSDMRTCSDYSDTFYLNEDFLKPILARRYALLKELAFQKMLEEFIGGFNKLAFINKEGELIIINEDAGHWDDDDQIWFSNRSYVSYVSTGIPSHYAEYGHYPTSQSPNANNSAIVEYYKGVKVAPNSSESKKQSFDEWIESQLDDYATINEFTGGIWDSCN